MGVPINTHSTYNSSAARNGPFGLRRYASGRPRTGSIQQVRLPARLNVNMTRWLSDNHRLPIIPPIIDHDTGLPRPPTPPVRVDHPEPPLERQADYRLVRNPNNSGSYLVEAMSSPENAATPASDSSSVQRRRRRSISPRTRPELRRNNAVRYPRIENIEGRGLDQDEDDQAQGDIDRMREELMAVRRYWRSLAHSNQSTSDLPLLNREPHTTTGDQSPVQIAERDLPLPANVSSRVSCKVLKITGRPSRARPRRRDGIRRTHRFNLNDPPGQRAEELVVWARLFDSNSPDSSPSSPEGRHLLEEYYQDMDLESAIRGHETVDIANPSRHSRFPVSDERSSGHRHVRFVTDEDGRVRTIGPGQMH